MHPSWALDGIPSFSQFTSLGLNALVSYSSRALDGMTLFPTLWDGNTSGYRWEVVSYHSLDLIECNIYQVCWHHTSFMSLGWHTLVLTLQPAPWGGNTSRCRWGRGTVTKSLHHLRGVSYHLWNIIERYILQVGWHLASFRCRVWLALSFILAWNTTSKDLSSGKAWSSIKFLWLLENAMQRVQLQPPIREESCRLHEQNGMVQHHSVLGRPPG